MLVARIFQAEAYGTIIPVTIKTGTDVICDESCVLSVVDRYQQFGFSYRGNNSLRPKMFYLEHHGLDKNIFV